MTLFGNDSDCELELLPSNNSIEAFGEHELKTAPLVTKDAADLCGKFVQRGFLGSVLSTHSDGIPSNTSDPRLYMNLDAPSSGLVCGVQGSGKSHSVSCIMESSLIVDRRIGTLPAPLATVVFHFDEENGGRPCEAAFLSELKSGDRGVKEVVVLVSPSNLRTRKAVYKSLKYVDVQALRIAEDDINASRMLSMMGADNLETMPLYLHTALSILREMGSDDFTYAGFRKRLSDSEFNQSQMAMLQLRLDLLDSFLQGKGGDVSSFFKPGRLVIIDLSDPFIDGITAAMLFDICLGLFIEWKSSTGKLIVLDEAHKYLTNTDANRFTKSICSIIRQQRHLAARVVVSTQEPTVVPASVLDLLSWVVCHRFSSPSWVKHLMHHLCVEEEEVYEKTSSTSKTFDWGQRVMTLHTGEALIYSPASVFLSNDRKLGNLGTGYAIVKMRARLTTDGGESLLATAPTVETIRAAAPESGMLTPASSSPRNVASSPSLVEQEDYVLDIRSIMHRSNNSRDAPQAVNTASENAASRASSTTAPALAPSTVPTPKLAHSSNPPANASNIGGVPAVTTSAVASTTISKQPPKVLSTAVKTVAKINASTTTTTRASIMASNIDQASLAKYKTLVDVLTALKEEKVDISGLADAVLKRNKTAYSGKFKKWLEGAEAAGIISLTSKKSKCWASLNSAIHLPSALSAVSNEHAPRSMAPAVGNTSAKSTLLPSSHPNITPEPPLPSSSDVSPFSTPSQASITKYRYLIAVMNVAAVEKGAPLQDISLFAGTLRKLEKSAIQGKVRSYMETAQTAGVVSLQKRDSSLLASLHPSLRMSAAAHKKLFEPLVSTIKKSASPPGAFVAQEKITAILEKQLGSGGWMAAGYAKLKDFLKGAEKAGLIKIQGKMLALRL